jgi:hypothetical protein
MPILSPAAILDENLALTAALSGGNWTLPLDNLLLPNVIEAPARCAAGTPDQAWFDIVFPSPCRWDVLLISGGTTHRRTAYRLSWYADPADRSPASLLAGGPAAPWRLAYPRVTARAERDYFAGNFWTGAPSAAEIAGNAPRLVVRPAVSPRCRAVRVEIDNQGLPLDLGHLLIGRALRPGWPHDWNKKIGGEQLTLIETTPMGARIGDLRPTVRTKTVTYRELTKAEAQRLYRAGLRLGGTGPLAIIDDITDSRWLWAETWLGTLAEGVVEIEETGPDRWTAALKIKEIVA